MNCAGGICEVSEELVEWASDYPEEFMLHNGGDMEPYAPAGPVDGFQFTAVPSGSLADELGFQEDDVVTKINGYALGTFSTWASIVGSLDNASRATVTYERSSTVYTLTVSVVD